MVSKTTVGLLFLSAAAFPQTPPTFEVASVKPSAPITVAIAKAGLEIGITMDGGRVDINRMSLSELLQRAYGVKSYQVSGPDWIFSERYDIRAKLPEGASKDQVPEMLQTLLAERFKLALHRDNKEHAAYALVVGKGGVKMQETEPDPPAADGGKSAGGVRQYAFGGTAGEGKGVAAASGKPGVSTGSGIHMERKMTTAALADFVSRFVDRPVVDMTDLKGAYEVALDIPLDALLQAKSGAVVVTSVVGPVDTPASSDTATDPTGSMIFSSIQQLGLKLEPRKLPVELLVVDRAEKVPTEN